MPEATQSRLSLLLHSTLDCVAKVEETALGFAQTAGFDQDTAGCVGLVCREAAANAVIHGNRYDRGRYVAATFEITSAALIVTVADQGLGLSHEAFPDPRTPENVLRGSGRGVFLMRAFMDEARFRRLETGTEVTLVKRRTHSGPGSSKCQENRENEYDI